MRKLPKIKYRRRMYYVDFRLEELRSLDFSKIIKFTQLPSGANSSIKKKLRGLRFRTYGQVYMRGLDD